MYGINMYLYGPIHLPYKSTIHVGIWVFPNLMGTPKFHGENNGKPENPY